MPAWPPELRIDQRKLLVFRPIELDEKFGVFLERNGVTKFRGAHADMEFAIAGFFGVVPQIQAKGEIGAREILRIGKMRDGEDVLDGYITGAGECNVVPNAGVAIPNGGQPIPTCAWERIVGSFSGNSAGQS